MNFNFFKLINFFMLNEKISNDSLLVSLGGDNGWGLDVVSFECITGAFGTKGHD
jgi:hypothetical protein